MSSTALVPVEAAEADQDAPPPFDTQWKLNLGRQFVPYPVTALLWAGAQVAHVVPEALPVTACTYLVVAVAWWTVWARKHPESRAQRRRWATTVVLGGGAWLMWAAVHGPTGLSVTALAVGMFTVVTPYWRRNRIPIPPKHRGSTELAVLEPPDDAPQIEVVEDDIPWTVARWIELVASPSGALPGSYLTNHRVEDGVEFYTIQLRSGRETTDTALAAAPRVASALLMSMSQVAIDVHPTGDASKALLMVTGKSPLQNVPAYPGPLAALDLTDGNIRAWIGLFQDGTDLWWDFYRCEWGACGGVVIGGTRSGKSELLKSIITTAVYSKLIVPFLADPQGGQSVPEYARHGHWPATTEGEILRQARALDRALTARSHINGLRGRKLHVPTQQEPILLWVVDECHKVFKAGSEIAEIADRIAREGGKAGVVLVAASQYPGLETFGNRDSLRNSLLAGNGVCLRLATKDVGGMLPGLQGNPHMIPRKFPDGTPTSGMGYTVGERTTPFRAALVRNPMELAAAAPVLEVERATAGYMGQDYTDRHIRHLVARAELAAELDQHDPELVAAITENDPELAEMLRTVQQRQAKALAAPAVPAAPTPRPAGGVAALTVPKAPTLQIAPLPAPNPGTAVERIYLLLREGVTRKGALVDRSGYSETQVRNALDELMGVGRVERVSHGEYRAA